MAYSLNELNNRLPKLIVIMKKHELLKHAYDNYPKGTKFKNLFTKEIHTSTGKFKLTDFSVCEEESFIMLMQHSHGIWAEIVSDRKPLLKTTNGVDIFKGDTFYWVTKLPDRYCNPIQSVMNDNIPESDLFTFDTNEAAIEWIEAQKPKIIEVEGKLGYIALVEKGFVTWKDENIPRKITQETVGNILKAMEELQNA